MSCCSKKTRTSSPPPQPTKLKKDTHLQIPNAGIHLLAGDPEAAVELSRGDLSVFHLTEDSVPLATVIKVGNLSWPLTKDEPVVKLDQLHYLFTIPDEEAGFLNYGVSFAGGAAENRLASFDQFLKENSCFSAANSADSSSAQKTDELYWKDYAPNIEDYNGVLAKAIAQGTGEIVKGIFKLSNEYSNQVQKGARLINSHAGERKNEVPVDGSRKRGGINNTLKRVRKLSKMTEKMSYTFLNGVLALTGNVAAPLVRSKAGKSLFSSVPGEVLLASLDALSKVLDAAEFAEKRAFAATSGAVTKAVSKRLGENAGEATEDVLATAGHAIGTAWNVFKIRKAINPKAAITSNIINNAGRKKF